MKDHINLTKTAELLCVSRRTLYNMIDDGRFDVKSYGKGFKFSKLEVKAWAKRNNWGLLE